MRPTSLSVFFKHKTKAQLFKYIHTYGMRLAGITMATPALDEGVRYNIVHVVNPRL